MFRKLSRKEGESDRQLELRACKEIHEELENAGIKPRFDSEFEGFPIRGQMHGWKFIRVPDGSYHCDKDVGSYIASTDGDSCAIPLAAFKAIAARCRCGDDPTLVIIEEEAGLVREVRISYSTALGRFAHLLKALSYQD